MDAPNPGIYYDVPEADYRSWPYDHYSALAMFRDTDLCELEIAYALEHPQEATDAMNLGHLVEAAIDNPDTVGNETQQLPEGIKARRGQAWLDLQAENPGVTYLPASEYAKHGNLVAQARAMAASVKADPIASVLVAPQVKRQVAFVHDLKFVGMEGTEVTHRVKGLVDYLTIDDAAVTIADLKTSAFTSPRKFGASVWNYAYDVQCALYADAIEALTGKLTAFYFVTVRSQAPYVVTVYNGKNSTEMAGAVLDIGRRAYQCYLEQLHECRETGKWRGYYSPDAPSNRVLDIQLPSWAV